MQNMVIDKKTCATHGRHKTYAREIQLQGERTYSNEKHIFYSFSVSLDGRIVIEARWIRSKHQELFISFVI